MDLKLLEEAARRGILPPEKQALYEEAVKRGLVGGQPQKQEPVAEERSWGEALSEGVTNIPRSSAELVKNVTYPFLNPVEFSKSMGALLSGDEEAVGGLKTFLVDRYGGEEQLKNTIAQDPVGALSDVALLFTGLGAGVKGAATLGRASQVGKVGQSLSTVGKVIDPINAMAKGAGATVSGIGKAVPALSPERMVIGTLKKGSLSSKVTPEQQMSVAKTLLEKDIPVSQKGLQMTGNILDDIDAQIGAFVDTASSAGDTVPRAELLRSLWEMKSRDSLYFHSADRAKNFRIIDKVMADVRKNYPVQVPVKDVQKLKQNTQSFVRKNYGKLGSTAVEARKALAHSARQSLADKYPELAVLNANSKEMIELQKILEPAVARISSRDMIGIGLPIKVGAGAALDAAAGGGSTGATLGLISGIVDTPAVKNWLARTLYKIRQGKITERPAGRYAARESSRQAGRTSQQVQGQREPLLD